MKKFVLAICLIFLGCSVLAFDIVYPKKNNVTINAQSTFFIGSSDVPLKINGHDVPLHPTGAFAYVADLKDGENKFVIQSENDRRIFIVTKPSIPPARSQTQQFIPYGENKYFYVTTEGAPLRTTPIDAGINRMAHLQRNICLTSDGEKNGFYRIVLDNDKFGWISKTNVKELLNYDNNPALVPEFDFYENNKYYIFVFHLNKSVPFEISENPLRLSFFNIADKGTYTKEFALSPLYGYGGEYQDDDFVWKIRKPPVINAKKTLKNITIAVDAGHGGTETGAIGCLGDMEKDITLSIAKYLETELTKRGAKVIMTRDDDIYVGLKDRVEKANEHDAVVLLSIHANALPDGADPNKISGTSIYYYYNQAKPLAQTLLDTMTAKLETNNDKVRQASFALVRNTNALSLLIEIAYLINPDDNAKLVNPEFQKNCAKAIADGLEKYFSEF